MKYFVVICLIGFCAAKKLPSYINVCKPKDTDIGKCIIHNINEVLRPKLLEGIPEMGIPSIHPLVIPFAELKLGDSFKASIKDIKVWDVECFIIEDLTVNPKNVTIELKIKLPTVRAEAEFNVQGKILILTLNGTGPGQVNLTNIEAVVTATGNEEPKYGKAHMVLKQIDIKPKVERIRIQLDNLFPTSPEISRNANKLLNDNNQILIEEFLPLVVDIIKEFIFSILQNVFSKYPTEVLFPGYLE